MPTEMSALGLGCVPIQVDSLACATGMVFY